MKSIRRGRSTEYLTREEAKDPDTKAVVVDRELKKLYEEAGDITPKSVLEKARDKNDPLHKFFLWDDSEAAERYRLEQAYRMLQASKYVAFLQKRKEPVLLRAIVNVDRGESFKLRNEVLDDKELRSRFIERKRTELRGWCKSVLDISEFDEIREFIECQLP